MPAHFSNELFRFLEDLRENNDRDWFQRNKQRYEEQVKAPLLRFVVDFSPKLNRISSRFIADPRPVGGSMFRIYRDTRFAKDKTPYKTAAAAQFRHEQAKDVHAPCFYLHLEPGNCFAGGGLWRPDGPSTTAIREAIVEDPAGWKRATRSKRFAQRFSLDGDTLKRPPRGFDRDHPLIEDLKRKDFVAATRFSDAEICSASFLEAFNDACRTMRPMVRFLTTSLELPF